MAFLRFQLLAAAFHSVYQLICEVHSSLQGAYVQLSDHKFRKKSKNTCSVSSDSFLVTENTCYGPLLFSVIIIFMDCTQCIHMSIFSSRRVPYK